MKNFLCWTAITSLAILLGYGIVWFNMKDTHANNGRNGVRMAPAINPAPATKGPQGLHRSA